MASEAVGAKNTNNLAVQVIFVVITSWPETASPPPKSTAIDDARGIQRFTVSSYTLVTEAERNSALACRFDVLGENEKIANRIESPTIITSAGNLPKRIAEFVGRVNTKTADVSIAQMTSPCGWQEPGQTPEFDEYTMVLRGSLRVETKSGVIDVSAGQVVIALKGEWVRYSTPGAEGAEYVAVCVPAFSPGTVHRDA